MSAEQNLFDTRRQIDVKIPDAEGDRVITVKFPSDDQIERRQRSRKIVIKDIGRGVTETEITPNEETEMHIFSEVKVSGDADAAEAMMILDRVSESEILDVEREGAAFRVKLRVPGVTTEHLVKIPAQKDVMEYRRQATGVQVLPHGKRRIKVNLEVGAKLYDKLCAERTGYAEGSAVPLNHKAQVISAALQGLDREIAGESEDAENF